MSAFVRLHRRVSFLGRNRYRDAEPVVYIAVSRIVAFGDSYADAVNRIMQADGAWIHVPKGDCPGDDDEGEFHVTESADEIARLIEEARLP